jgi:hypothetical protein
MGLKADPPPPVDADEEDDDRRSSRTLALVKYSGRQPYLSTKELNSKKRRLRIEDRGLTHFPATS